MNLMSDIQLSKEQALELLHKLATDDAFRSSYEASPLAALKSAGVPEGVVLALSTQGLEPTRLMGKDQFQNAFQQVQDDLAEVCLCHRPPSVNLHQHGVAGGKAAATSTPFAK